MEMLNSADFWIGLVKIIWINIILSGDNAVVIALAARSLPPEQQKKAIMFGSGAAVVLRIVLTVVAAKLLELSFLQVVGGCLLLWIGYQLLTGEEDGDGESKGHGSMMTAIRTILIADLVMSLDNVLAVAAVARNDLPLLEKSQNPVATNPDDTLRAIATERGWRILELFPQEENA